MSLARAIRRVWPWLLIPGTLFAGLEAYARATVARVPTGYRAAEQIGRVVDQSPQDTMLAPRRRSSRACSTPPWRPAAGCAGAP